MFNVRHYIYFDHRDVEALLILSCHVKTTSLLLMFLLCSTCHFLQTQTIHKIFTKRS